MNLLSSILRFSIHRRGLVMVAVLVAAVAGAVALARLPIDAVPDITNRQVQVNAVSLSLSPVEIEKQVTFPLENALAGIPGLESTRSLSRNGFCQVTAVFHDDVDVYFARQQVSERMAGVRDALPPGVEPQLGPISTGLSEIYMWVVEFEHPAGAGAVAVDGSPGWQSDHSYLTPEGERLSSEVELAGYLRTVQDWIVRPQLRGIPGVAGVDSLGGFVKQYQVRPDPRELTSYGLTFQDLVEALERNNVSTGAGFLEHNGESWIVRVSGRLTTKEQIAGVVVAEREGVPLRVRDVADVVIGGESRTGSATENGEEVVLGTALMLLGANSRTVSTAVDARMAEVARTLPPDVRVKTVLNRTNLVDATIHTVARNLVEGAILVVVVLFAMLGNIRAAVITASAIPLSMLLTAIGMQRSGTSGNLMSLGAIDFGLLVDGAVILVENCLRLLAERQRQLGRVLTVAERLDVVEEASGQMRRATAYGVGIIITVYAPVLTLTGVEGKMFHPMAVTVIVALAAAFVLSLTWIPASVALFLTGRVEEHENAFVAAARRLYVPLLELALAWRKTVLAGAVAVLMAAAALFPRLGQEFAPTLGELDIVAMVFRIPSTGLAQATQMQRELERHAKQVPEVAFVFSRTGTAEMAADPMPPYLTDTFFILKPREQWPDPGATKADVRERIEAVLEREPGSGFEMSQPIEMRFNELLAGVRSDVGVKVFGDEFAQMLPAAREIARVLDSIPGSAGARVEEVEGATVLGIDVDRDAISRYGLSVADVQDVVAVAVGGREAGQLYQGDRRYDIVVRLPERFRDDPTAIESLPVMLTHEDPASTRVSLGADAERSRPGFLPLSAVADVGLAPAPNQVSREDGKRRIVVQVNVRDRDIGSFVEEAQRRIAAEVKLPTGSWLGWGGQFENLVHARQRLAVVVPACFALIFFLLYQTFGAARPAAIVFSGVPLALSGGVFALWLRAMPFSICAAIGFIAVSGIAVLNGLVMLTFIHDLELEGLPFREAIVRGASTRLRPVLMTALVASLGFVPMALAAGTGAEVQRPLATVVIGGLLTSTVLTLFVLPALCRLLGGGARNAAREA